MRALLTTALIVGLTQGAVAQRRETETGSRVGIPYRARIPDATGISAAERGRLAMEQFASCVLDRSRRGVGEALAQKTEPAQNSRLARLADSNCLASGQMRFQAIVMRGAIFAELYRRRERNREAAPMVASYDLTRAAGAEGQLATYWWVLDFADCVVARDRAASAAFVVEPAVSDRETAALKVLKPALGPCVTAEQKITLDRATIKGALAEALYRGPARPAAIEERK